MISLRLAHENLTKALQVKSYPPVFLLLMNYGSLYLTDKVEEMTHAQKTSPVDMKIATIKPRPSSRCLVTPTDMNVSDQTELA